MRGDEGSVINIAEGYARRNTSIQQGIQGVHKVMCAIKYTCNFAFDRIGKKKEKSLII